MSYLLAYAFWSDKVRYFFLKSAFKIERPILRSMPDLVVGIPRAFETFWRKAVRPSAPLSENEMPGITQRAMMNSSSRYLNHNGLARRLSLYSSRHR